MKNICTAEVDSGSVSGKAMFASEGRRPLSRRLLWIVGGDEGYGFRRAHLGFAGDLSSRGVEIGFVIREKGTFAEELEKAGYDVFFLSERKKDRGVRNSGISYFWGCLESLRDSLVHQREIESLIRSFRADWVHVSINSGILKAGLAARRAKIPVFWHIHNTINSKFPFGLQSLSYRYICRFWNIKPLANSRHTADSLGGGDGFCGVVYPGSDEQVYSSSARFDSIAKEELGLSAETATFLVAARLVEAKAQHLLVDAFLDLIEEGAQVALLLAGGPLDSQYAAALKARVEEAGACRSIQFLGQVEDVRPYVCLADVVINSRQNAEPFGLTVIESQFLERPVLAYALGGPSETILDGETGWLINESTRRSYKEGVKRALNARGSWKSMGAKARQRAVPLYSLQASSISYLELVDKNKGT